MKTSQIKNKQYWKQKIKSDIHRKNLKKQIFGDHYNLAAIRLNNNKKYFNEQTRIMQIEKSNRMLLQKIKKISQRSKPRHIIERARTQVTQNQIFKIQRSSTQEKLKKNSLVNIKKQRYPSFDTTLQKSRPKRNSSFNENKTEMKKQENQILEEDKNKSYLFRGKRIIDKVLFKFEIFIKNGTYTILSKTQTSQQKIQIPESNYQTLLKSQLENNHKNIFRNLKLLQNNKLQLRFKDATKIQIDLVQKSSIELPLIKNPSLNSTNNM